MFLRAVSATKAALWRVRGVSQYRHQMSGRADQLHASSDAGFLSEPSPEHIIFFIEIGRKEYLGSKHRFNLPEQNLAFLMTELSSENSQEKNTATTVTV